MGVSYQVAIKDVVTSPAPLPLVLPFAPMSASNRFKRNVVSNFELRAIAISLSVQFL
ncbi:MAG TPA: hypothetical protein V6D14_17065 [Coleofasciculaceae cyanobacterium]